MNGRTHGYLFRALHTHTTMDITFLEGVLIPAFIHTEFGMTLIVFYPVCLSFVMPCNGLSLCRSQFLQAYSLHSIYVLCAPFVFRTFFPFLYVLNRKEKRRRKTKPKSLQLLRMQIFKSLQKYFHFIIFSLFTLEGIKTNIQNDKSYKTNNAHEESMYYPPLKEYLKKNIPSVASQQEK